MINNIKSIISDNELLYIVLRLLKNDDAKNLSVILDIDSFVKLVDVFGGLSINIPKKSEVEYVLKVCLAYYYKNYCSMSWVDIQKIIPEAGGIKFHNYVEVISKELGSETYEKFSKLNELLNKDVKNNE